MPPPTTTPVPTPSQIIQLVPADTGPVSQPTATIIAASLAVLAALIALGGVYWQIRRADTRAAKDRRAAAAAARHAARSADDRARADREASARAQRELLEAQAATRKEDRDEARSKSRREEKRDALTALTEDLIMAAEKAWDLIFERRKWGNDWDEPHILAAFQATLLAVRLGTVRSTLVRYFDCHEIAVASHEVLDLARDLALSEDDDDDEANRPPKRKERVDDAIRDVIHLIQVELGAIPPPEKTD